MRLICTLGEEEADQLQKFSFFLQGKGIENHIEELRSSVGEPMTYQLWITEEDQVKEALQFYKEFQQNPDHKKYKEPKKVALQEDDLTPGGGEKGRSFGIVSMTILLVALFIFLWSQLDRERVSPPELTGVIQAPFLAPVEKAFLYDYPYYFQLRDQLFTLWTVKQIKEKVPPSPEAITLLQKLKKTPVWMGIYDRLITHKEEPLTILDSSAPLFEKIRQGQVWRILTPIFLHYDLLHIFFNILWWLILANQIERRIGAFRLLLLVIIAAVLSNTAQYLMSGPFFMGLSGVICALAAFIWARQQKAPWEGYLLHRLTLIFLAVFVLGMFLLSTLFFILQYFQGVEVSAVIANTAHLAGALVGYFLGRTRLFASHL